MKRNESKRNENVIVWTFFSIALIGTYMFLLQQPNEALSSRAYLISAFVAISLTFLLDRYLKNRKAKAEKEAAAKKSHSKKDSKKSASANSGTGSESKRSKNAKRKKKNKK
ncbi:hypothetical protein [Desulfitobacterium sp.]|uniref:hypothetical protein n=1 Tax=Desulfitobacterium sp. TaxID=49981 RepID=UPI002B2213C7|nr:hypothetical protein [Desulfitobacterium sp.]MEA4900362.1 hypothetical protein [Desulfitobacterium sp.]